MDYRDELIAVTNEFYHRGAQEALSAVCEELREAEAALPNIASKRALVTLKMVEAYLDCKTTWTNCYRQGRNVFTQTISVGRPIEPTMLAQAQWEYTLACADLAKATKEPLGTSVLVDATRCLAEAYYAHPHGLSEADHAYSMLIGRLRERIRRLPREDISRLRTSLLAH
jgi:hypothetical protein